MKGKSPLWTLPAGHGVLPGVLVLPQLLRLGEDLGALHPQQQEHRHDRQQGRHRVRDDVLKQKQMINVTKILKLLWEEAIINALFPHHGKLPENPHT